MEEQSGSHQAMQREFRKYQLVRKALNKSDAPVKKQPKSPFQLVQAGIDRSIGRLVELLGDDDRAVVEQVLRELFLLGNRVIGPLERLTVGRHII
jgi:hypothetical protein